MAKLGDLNINVGIEISRDTVDRCCQLLQMYLMDHPDKDITSFWSHDCTTGQEVPSVYIQDREQH